MKALRWKLLVVIGVLVAAGWLVYPTVVYYSRYYNLSPDEKARVPKSKLEGLKKKSLNLGLDLQGGMYIILEVDRSKLSPEEAKDATDRALEVIRNRVDQWGVSEPSLQKIGGDRIMIQLPGVMDRERARSLIGRTALLEFKLLADEKMTIDLLERIDRRVSIGASGAPADTTASAPAPEAPETTATASDTTGVASGPSGAFMSLINVMGADLVVPEDNVDSVNRILARDDVKAIMPSGYEFVWGRIEESGARKFRRFYLLKSEAELTGAYITDSKVTVGGGNDPQIANKPVVLLSFNRQGAARFAQITGRNVGKRLAIILDGTVYSAPVIRERIAGGNAQITGMESMEEAKDLSVVLKAGALPAPVNIVEERSIGPTLGGDSVRSGMIALIVGFLVVVLFMAIYYRIGGLIADLALFLNLWLIVAILALFHATLTFPGMAGLILTVGMAVDANVLIFERMREELRAGKGPRAAVEAGYRRSTITILDSNLTTIIAALVLMRFGTGPIKGFAVVLTIGIIASFFTAVFVTRIIFDYMTVVREAKKLPI
ncbi:MAG: protein translocase subunit SecD [candidate division WOR-3 bacterium]